MSFFTDTFDQFLQMKRSSIYILVINQNKGQSKIRTLAFWPEMSSIFGLVSAKIINFGPSIAVKNSTQTDFRQTQPHIGPHTSYFIMIEH